MSPHHKGRYLSRLPRVIQPESRPCPAPGTAPLRRRARCLSRSTLRRVLDKASCRWSELAELAHVARGHLGVALNVRPPQSLPLDLPRRFDALANDCGCLADRRRPDLLRCQRRHFDLQVDSIEQRTGDLGEVSGDLNRRTDALVTNLAARGTSVLLASSGERITLYRSAPVD
jgi:hypothetical protein